MLVHHPSEGMMAILQQLKDRSECTVDQTPQYIFLLLSKVALDTLVLSFWQRSISKSLLGICSISMYMVDLLMVGSISWAWWFQQGLSTHESVCFTLSHSSTVYTLLPLPVLVVGTIDYVAHRYPEAGQSSAGRTAWQCGTVLVLWVLACSYSYCYTNTELLLVDYEEGAKALVCPVQASTVVSLFNLNLSFVIGFVLLLYYQGLCRWVDLASRVSRQRACTQATKLGFSSELEALEAGPVEESPLTVGGPPLFVSLTLCFALNWSPYLLMSVASDALGFAVPAYATVNLLWMACANSLMVGMVFWYGSENKPPHKSPDDICEWSIYWCLSTGDRRTMASETAHNKLSAPDTADVDILEV